MDMTFLLSTPEKIAADYELSERLGREILDAGCEPLAPSAPVKSYMAVLVTRTNVVSQQQWMEWVYV